MKWQILSGNEEEEEEEEEEKGETLVPITPPSSGIQFILINSIKSKWKKLSEINWKWNSSNYWIISMFSWDVKFTFFHKRIFLPKLLVNSIKSKRINHNSNYWIIELFHWSAVLLDSFFSFFEQFLINSFQVKIIELNYWIISLISCSVKFTFEIFEQLNILT